MFTRWLGKGLGVALVAGFLSVVLALPAFADSQVRIVRLSDLNGDVLIDRGAGQGFERALLNMPIVQGAKIWTKSQDARAEVEFENGSAVRLAPDSQVAFPQLVLRDSGVRASTIQVSEGTVYFTFHKDKADDFQVQFGRETVNVPKSADFRIDIAKDQAKLAVTKGDVDVQDPAGAVQVAKDKTATFDLGNDTSTVAKGVAPEPYDTWNKDEGQFQQQYASAGSPYKSPYSYGWSDLNYYGDYYSVPGYGWMWQPYGVGPGWDPFANGAWSFYPGFGYSWVSTYPWGWLPYRYGSWAFVPGFGWGWQPGAYWGGWTPYPILINPPAGFVPPKPPTGGTRTVLVNPPANATHPGLTNPTIGSVKPGVINDGVNHGVQPVAPKTAAVPGAVHGMTPARGEMPSSVHGTTVFHGVAAPPPGVHGEAGAFGMSRSGAFGGGGFGRAGGAFHGGGGFSHVGAASSGGHASSTSNGSHH